MRKSYGLLAFAVPAAFAVGCNLDTGITVSWSTSVCSAANAYIRVSGTSSSGAAARESCGSTSMTSCVAGTQVINCSSGTVTILNWASGIWTIKVDLIAGTDTNGTNPVATSYLACKTVTEGQTTNLGSVTLSQVDTAPTSCTSGGGGSDAGTDAGTPAATTVAINFTFGGAGNTSCSSADLSGTGGAAVTNPTRGLRYKLNCGGTEYKNTTDNTAQQTLCATNPTALSAFTVTSSGSCTLEAQLVDDDPATTGAPYPEHCDYYATSSVTVTASQANNLTIDLAKQVGGTCPLTKIIW